MDWEFRASVPFSMFAGTNHQSMPSWPADDISNSNTFSGLNMQFMISVT
jgi:hypothetical protein